MEPLIKLLRLVSNQTCDMEIFLPKTQALVWLKFPPVESLKYQRSWKRPDLEVFCNKNFVFTFWDVGTVCYQHEWLAGPRQTQRISCRVILITNSDRSEIIDQPRPVQSAQQQKISSNNSHKLLYNSVESSLIPAFKVKISNLNTTPIYYINKSWIAV